MELSDYIAYLCAAHGPEMAHKEVMEKIAELHGQVMVLNKLRDTYWRDWTKASMPTNGLCLWVRKSMNDGHTDPDEIESFSTYGLLEEHCKGDLGLTDAAFKELLKTGNVYLNEKTSTVFNYSLMATWKVFLEVHPDDEPFQVWEDGDDE